MVSCDTQMVSQLMEVHMIAPTKIAEVLGGEEVLKGPVHSFFELEWAVEEGLPKTALKNVANFISSSQNRSQFIYQVVPEGSYKRRRSHLSLKESERTERLARVIATAIHIWDNPKQAKEFLITPHPFFKERPPIEVAFSELGARQVEEHLWGIFYGLPL